MRRTVALLATLLLACGGDDDEPPGADTADAAAPIPDAAANPAIWSPPPGTTWQWQLDGTIDTSFDVAMYDIDLVETPQDVIDALHADGRIVICYFSAGSRETFRPDADDFPPEAVGRPLDGWPGERWIDVRDPTVRTIMETRLDLAVTKRCDGVEPDNLEGYANPSGFPLTADDQLDFNRFLATAAHTRNLSIGLKNDVEQVPDLVGDFDWSLDEECFLYDECPGLSPFIDAGKAVFHVEYGPADKADTVCPVTTALGFSTLIKRLNLTAWRVPCP